jgi:hypothetical protein
VAYYLYGVRLRSEWALPYPKAPQPFVAEVALVRRAAAHFSLARMEAGATPQGVVPVKVQLDDGRTYLHWRHRFEFLISADGRTIAALALARSSREGFHTYLLGQALSFALIKQGLDPLHGTVVTVDGAAAAFLGDSGFGKSSLAAAFIGAGDRLLTDDLLVLTEARSGFDAQPGPSRLKLYPQAARMLLPRARGTRIMPPMSKLIVQLGSRQVTRGATPLTAVYVLASPGRGRVDATRVTIRRMWQRQACLAIIRNTFNASVTDAVRLARQFDLATRIAGSVPVKSLSFSRSFRQIPAVRAAILADLAQESAREVS